MNTLSHEEFKNVVKNTPIIAIDFIIENSEGKILLGRRNNSPARGYWFVPGGRIHKDELYEAAFKRLLKAETGIQMSLADSCFLGIYQHIYPHDNFAGDPTFGTHYIVIAYRIRLQEALNKLPEEQHSGYWWASVDQILEDDRVHQNTKNYFNGFPSLSG